MDTFANQGVKFEESGAAVLMMLARTVVGPLICIVCMVCQLHAIPNTHIQSDPINPKYPIKTVVKEATTQALPKKKKALVAVFGVFSRSLRNTWPQINRMIVKPLEKDYDVEIYGFNNQVDNIDTLDGQPIQKSSADTIKTNHKLVYEEVRQSALDDYIKRDKVNSWLARTWKKDLSGLKKNPIRQFYLEQHVSNYISNSNEDYDVVIALIADCYPLTPLSMDDIILKNNVINLVSFQSVPQELKSANIVTNGYYLGTKRSVPKIMSTVTTATTSPINKEAKRMFYESMVYKTLVANKLVRHSTDMLFSKLRSSGEYTMLNDVVASEQFKRLGLIQRVPIHVKHFLQAKVTYQTQILAYTIFVIALLVITARKAAMWYHESIHKKPFLRKGDDSV